MPKFPEIDSEITCESALNMILASIAMEELALSHIINAEGEKLQYVLGTLETGCCKKPDFDEVLKVNQSVTGLLESVSQNQIILKNKMDKALQALSEVCPRPPKPPSPSKPPCPPDPPCPPGPPGPCCTCPCKCSATFTAIEKCNLWCAGSALHWNKEHLHGKCVCVDPSDKTKIELRAEGRFAISFVVNVRAKDCKCNAAVGLQMMKNHQRKELYTVHSHVPCDDELVTLSISGIIIENFDCNSSLLIKLESPDSLIVEDSMLSIIEI